MGGALSLAGCAGGAAALQTAVKVLQDAFGRELDDDGLNSVHSVCTNLETEDTDFCEHACACACYVVSCSH